MPRNAPHSTRDVAAGHRLVADEPAFTLECGHQNGTGTLNLPEGRSCTVLAFAGASRLDGPDFASAEIRGVDEPGTLDLMTVFDLLVAYLGSDAAVAPQASCRECCVGLSVTRAACG